jgi:hypothetical protein
MILEMARTGPGTVFKKTTAPSHHHVNIKNFLPEETFY